MKFFGPSLRQAPHERWISLRTKREVLSQTLSFFSVGFPNLSVNEHQAVNNDRQLHLHAIFLLAFRTAQQIKKPVKARALFPHVTSRQPFLTFLQGSACSSLPAPAPMQLRQTSTPFPLVVSRVWDEQVQLDVAFLLQVGLAPPEETTAKNV